MTLLLLPYETLPLREVPRLLIDPREIPGLVREEVVLVLPPLDRVPRLDPIVDLPLELPPDRPLSTLPDREPPVLRLGGEPTFAPPLLEPPLLEPVLLEPPLLEPVLLEPPLLEPPLLEPVLLDPPLLEPPLLEPPL